MIRWMVKKYLNKTLNKKLYQKLSLEQELGYADKLLSEDVRMMQQEHEKIMADITALLHVLNYIVEEEYV